MKKFRNKLQATLKVLFASLSVFASICSVDLVAAASKSELRISIDSSFAATVCRDSEDVKFLELELKNDSDISMRIDEIIFTQFGSIDKASIGDFELIDGNKRDVFGVAEDLSSDNKLYFKDAFEIPAQETMTLILQGDVEDAAKNGDTIAFKIADPATDVITNADAITPLTSIDGRTITVASSSAVITLNKDNPSAQTIPSNIEFPFLIFDISAGEDIKIDGVKIELAGLFKTSDLSSIKLVDASNKVLDTSTVYSDNSVEFDLDYRIDKGDTKIFALVIEFAEGGEGDITAKLKGLEVDSLRTGNEVDKVGLPLDANKINIAGDVVHDGSQEAYEKYGYKQKFSFLDWERDDTPNSANDNSNDEDEDEDEDEGNEDQQNEDQQKEYDLSVEGIRVKEENEFNDKGERKVWIFSDIKNKSNINSESYKASLYIDGQKRKTLESHQEGTARETQSEWLFGKDFFLSPGKHTFKVKIEVGENEENPDNNVLEKEINISQKAGADDAGNTAPTLPENGAGSAGEGNDAGDGGEAGSGDTPNPEPLTRQGPKTLPPLTSSYLDAVLTDYSPYLNPFPDTGKLGNLSDASFDNIEAVAAAELYRRNISKGHQDGRFLGSNSVNRAEAATFLIRSRYEDKDIEEVTAEDVKKIQETRGELLDILSENGEVVWYTKYIVKAWKLGIISGYKDKDGKPTGKFGPEDPVKVGGFLVMIQKTFDLETNLTHSYDASSFPEKAFYLPFLGLANKYNLFPRITKDGNLDPNKKLTRYEVAVAIYQYFRLKGLENNIAPI